MSVIKSEKSALQAMIIILLVVVAYCLSIGPVAYCIDRYNIPQKPFDIMYAPLIWLYDNTPLDGPIQAYVSLFTE